MNYCYYLSLCPGVDRFIHQLFTAHMTAVPGIVPGSRDVVPEPVAWHPVAKTHHNIEPEVVMRATNQSWAGHGVLEWTSVWGVLYWKSLSKEWPAEIWVNTGSNTPLYGKNILSGEKCKFSAHRCMWSWTEWKSKRTGWLNDTSANANQYLVTGVREADEVCLGHNVRFGLFLCGTKPLRSKFWAEKDMAWLAVF